MEEEQIERMLQSIGEGAIGVQAVSLWVIDPNASHRIYHKGWWHDPTLSITMDSAPRKEALLRLTDSSRPDHVPAEPVASGVDIAGTLWTDLQKYHDGRRILKRMASLSAQEGEDADCRDASDGIVAANRCLRTLLQDPDGAKHGQRLKMMVQAGFEHSTAMSLGKTGAEGMVIFLSMSDLDNQKVNTKVSLRYLHQGACLLGCLLGMQESAKDVWRMAEYVDESVRNERRQHGIGDESPALADVERQAVEMAESDINMEKHQPPNAIARFWEFFRHWVHKFQGGGLQVPPSLSVRQSLWTCFGAFCGLAVLSAMNEYYKDASDGNYRLLVGPFGALMTLQYGLTSAPASQPRNAVFGQAIAGAASLLFTYIPTYILPIWLRTAVGPAVAIGVMVKCGVTHPPAGAHAVLYASGSYNWTYYALVVVSTAIAIIPAVLVNNMSTMRQYPTYWGVRQAVEDFGSTREIAFFLRDKSTTLASSDSDPSAQ